MEISGQSTALCVIFITHVLGFPTRGLKIDKNKKKKKEEGRGSLVVSGREEEKKEEE